MSTSSTDQKLDELKELLASSISALKQTQEENGKTMATMGDKLTKLEGDLAAAKAQQEDTTERALKRARRERPLELNRKGHEEQFHFNLQLQDNIAAASRQLGKVEAMERGKAIIDKAREELQEGTESHQTI